MYKKYSKKLHNTKDMPSNEERQEINELLLRIKNGDPTAAEQLFARTKIDIKRIAHIYLNNPRNDEEVLQEVFIRIGVSIGTYNSLRDGYTWIYTITKNVAFTINKQEKRSIATESQIIENAPAQTDEFAEMEMSIFLEQTMSKLSERDQQIAKMLFLENQQQVDIARALGISEAAVSQRKAKILRILSKYYKKR